MTTAIPAKSHLTFGGILRSEWIKLVSLRSTVWCYVILVVLTVGLGVLIATIISTSDQPEVTGMVSPESAQSTWLSMSTAGIGFSQLVIAVLGALVITGEYATGMIRSTFAAVPRRLPALAAKVLVFGFVSFVVALAALVVTALLIVPIFASADIEIDMSDSAVWLGLVGAAGFVALIGLMSLGIGAIIRNSAAAIAAALGLLLVVPTILQLLGALTRAEWALNAAVFLPSSVGSQISSYPSEPVELPDEVFQPIVLEPWQALLVLLAWVAVPLIVGAVLVKRRDT